MKDVKDYCKECANASTPICNSCTYIENSKGVSEPTEFVGVLDLNEITKSSTKRHDLAALISHRIDYGCLVPLRWVMEYNKLLEDEYNYGEK